MTAATTACLTLPARRPLPPPSTFKRTTPLPPELRARRRLLYIFAGASRPRDGFAALAAASGFEVDEIDILQGGESHDVLRVEVRERLLRAIRSGEYFGVLVATPCTSFSVARGNHADGRRHFGLRSHNHPNGPPGVDEFARRFLREHDAFVDFTAEVTRAALDADVDVIVENPAPRDDARLASHWPARAHLPQLWDMEPMRALRARAGTLLELLVIPQCAFGPGPHGLLFQKYTGLLCSPRAAARLDDLHLLTCNHARHDVQACGVNAVLAAAYPAPLVDALVWALSGVRRTDPLPAALARSSCAAAPAPPAVPNPPAATSSTPARPLAAPPASPPAAPPAALPPFDRSLKLGFIADGPALSEPIAAAVEAARHKKRKWASLRNLDRASVEELRAAPIPDLLPHRCETASPGPPAQPGAASRLAEFRRALGRDVHVEDLWVPAEWQRFQRWMRAARLGGSQPSAYFPQSSLVLLARGFRWDSRDPTNCVPMEPSTRDTTFPGKRQIDRAAFRRAAREVGSLDADIIGQVGEGGVESRSSCELTTELHSHAPGLIERPDAAAKEIANELKEEWALGPFYLPPTVPIRALPRDVVVQQRSRVLPNGEVEDYYKDRITLNPSRGDDSVNSGISKEEKEVKLTTARALGYGLAVIDVPAKDAGLSTGGYCADMTAAYSFLLMQRLDWWQFAFIWFDENGRAFFCLLVRVGFGGAMSPRRFQSVSVIVTALAKLRQREFDALHPLPAAVRAWCRARVSRQRAGLLPDGTDQVTPAVAGVYLDDLAGGCVDDAVPMPAIWRGMVTASVDLNALTAVSVGGKPLRRDSRPAVHCVIAIAAVREVGLEDAANKTEGGDVFVNLGLRLRLRDGLIDCPPPKQRIMLRDLGRWRDDVARLAPFERAMAERQVGRLGNLTQVLPELLLHLHAGFRAANAGYVRHAGGKRRKLAMVQLARGSLLHDGLSALLPHAIDIIERNEGVPLAPRALFAARDEPGVLLVVTDASGNDGCGGWAQLGTADTAPVVVSERWPDAILEARRQADLPRAQRTAGAPALSMPAAELWSTWAVAEAAAASKPHRAVIAVGDCDPAADALDAASSGVPQISSLLASARARVKQWLGVSLPREWNLDADRLSHPALLGAVLADARAANLRPRVARIPADCWAALYTAAALGLAE